MKAKTRQVDGLSHTRYALNRQIYAADVYPFSASNGSKIVVCGHEQGLLFLWRGGRAFKQERDNHAQQVSSNQDVEMSSSDDEQFEDAEHDPTQHAAPIIQQLDLPIGTAVLHLSFPQLPQLSRPQEVPLALKFLQRYLVVALACSDGSIRFLTLPLDPPSPSIFESKRLQQDPLGGQAGKGTWGEKLVTIQNAHQNIPRGVSIAFASKAATRIQDEDDEDDGSTIDVLLASHSADLSGTLLIHRIPVIRNKNRFGPPELWRSRSLLGPACNIDFHVSSSDYSNPRVLVGESSGVVRIFECTSAKHPAGEWSLSLFAPVSRISDNHTTSIFSVKWVLGGRAIAALTTDGGWGIWDISDGGKSGRSISGARPTPYTITGRVGTILSTAASKSSNQKVENRSQLAPMTPGTRKIRQESLFSGKTDSFAKRGGISIKYSAASLSTGEIDESVMFWYGDSVMHLPSLRTHWQNKFKAANSIFTTSANGQIRDVPSISLGGEARLSVSAFPSDNSSISSASGHLILLIVGERSLLFSSVHSITRITPSNLTTTNQSRVSDQSLLSRGLLDVDGLDRMLDGMQDD